MIFSQPFPLFQSPISSPAAAANRRVARAFPGTKTARHGRTNMPQNCTEKVPNVPSEFLERMFFSQPFPLFQSQPLPLFQSHQLTCCCCCCPIAAPGTKTAIAAAAVNRKVARAPPGTKTARHGRTNMPQNRTEKVPNVPSEFLEKMFFFPTFSAFSIPSAHLLLLLLKEE